jgi:DNA-binding XRE family transcriptional regulator
MGARGPKPMEFDEVMLKKIESLAAQGLTKTQIAQAIGIHRATLSKKKSENHEIDDAIKRGEAKGLATITNALFQSAREGNITAQIFYLKNRAPDEWKDRHHIEETRRHVGIDAEVKRDMTPQDAAASYAETLREGSKSNVVAIKREPETRLWCIRILSDAPG